jgi:molybdopterin synthase catalytic subunit
MAIIISEQSFDPWKLISKHQQQSQLASQFGATASFIGSMRDFNDDHDVSEMVLEYYPEMTQRYLEKLEADAKKQWSIIDCLIAHRVGHINPADAIVVIACWSAHRRASLDACNWLIEELKFKAPFWKKETRNNNDVWVEHNTSG